MTMHEDRNFNVPDELTLLEILGTEPVESRPKDGFWCYEVTDEFGTVLRISFNTFERSLQTSILLKGEEVISVVQEGNLNLKPIRFKDNWVLRGDFTSGDLSTVVEIHLSPTIQVRWYTLV